MTPVGIMCKALYDFQLPKSDASLHDWDSISAEGKSVAMEGMRVALRALAEMEPTQDMYLAGDKAQDSGESATAIARAYILAAASEGETP